MTEHSGVDVAAFIDKVETVATLEKLCELFHEASDLPAGDDRSYLRQRCLTKAQKEGWSAPEEPEFGC